MRAALARYGRFRQALDTRGTSQLLKLLALFTAVLILTEPPAGSEWIAVAFAFAIPIALLVMAYREWRTRP